MGGGRGCVVICGVGRAWSSLASWVGGNELLTYVRI
jgi:hypothetical protein